MPSKPLTLCALFFVCLQSFPASVKVKGAQLFLTLGNPIDCLWNYPGQNTGVGSHSLLQGIFPPQGLNPDLLHAGGDSLSSEPPRKPS